jgi:hypothetical protein
MRRWEHHRGKMGWIICFSIERGFSISLFGGRWTFFVMVEHREENPAMTFTEEKP